MSEEEPQIHPYAVYEVMFNGGLDATLECPKGRHPEVPSWVEGTRRGYPWKRLVNHFGIAFMGDVFEESAQHESEAGAEAETRFVAWLDRHGWTGYRRATRDYWSEEL